MSLSANPCDRSSRHASTFSWRSAGPATMSPRSSQVGPPYSEPTPVPLNTASPRPGSSSATS